LLKISYPNHEWHPWKFHGLPISWWRSEANRQSYFLWLSQQLGSKHPEIWYSQYNEILLANHGELSASFQIVFLY